LSSKTKGEIFAECKNYFSARCTITKHARAVLLKQPNHSVCHVCGYDKHTVAAHKKAVKEFPNDALISDINAPENIIPLCDRCHWEHDHNLLQIGCGSGSRTPVS
jgi:hypothetical protein